MEYKIKLMDENMRRCECFVIRFILGVIFVHLSHQRFFLRSTTKVWPIFVNLELTPNLRHKLIFLVVCTFIAMILSLGRRYASRILRVRGFTHSRWSAPVTAGTTPRLSSNPGLRRYWLGPAGLTSEFSVQNVRHIRMV
jgi:hypothetical protein